MRRIVIGAIGTFFCAALIGCSGFDSTQILVQPESVAASSTFDVALVNVFMYIDTAKTVSNKVERDSLHLIVGLPESWSVVAAQMVKVKDMATGQMLALQGGTMDPVALAAMVQKYQSLAVVLAADNTLPASLKGQTVSAHSVDASTTIDVAIDKVKQWKGFSAPVDIVLNKGDKYDTIVPLDSAIGFALASGMMPDSMASVVAGLKSSPLFKLPDTIGISVVPVAIFLKIQAGSALGNDTLYYFSKTDSMNPKPSPILTTAALLTKSSSLTKMEAGDMTFAAVTVKDAAAVQHRAVKFSASGVRAVADFASGSVHISLGNLDPAKTGVSIYSLQGTLVKSLVPHSSEVVWDGRTACGQKTPAGMYFVRIGEGAGSLVQAVHLVR